MTPRDPILNAIVAARLQQGALERAKEGLIWMRDHHIIDQLNAHVQPTWGHAGIHLHLPTKEQAEVALARFKDELEVSEWTTLSSTGNYVTLFSWSRFHLVLWLHYPSVKVNVL